VRTEKVKSFRLNPLLPVSPARPRGSSGLAAGCLPLAMAIELPFSPAAASVRSSGFVLYDSLRGSLAGVGLDLLTALLLVWATVGLLGLPLRLSLALALFVCLQQFGGGQREPQGLAFSVTVETSLVLRAGGNPDQSPSGGRRRQTAVAVDAKRKVYDTPFSLETQPQPAKCSTRGKNKR
jgi:hypothetical protein